MGLGLAQRPSCRRISLHAIQRDFGDGLSSRGYGIATFLSAAGLPLQGVVVEVPALHWVAHVLFWTPALVWVVGRVRRAGRRWQRRGARSGNPALRAAEERRRPS